MKLCLVMFKEDGSRKEFPIQTGKTIIGRQDTCGLRIPLGEISRQHAVVMVEAETVTLRDLGSSNGTYVNNQRITEQELEAGDHIVIGPVVFTVQIDGQPSEVRPAQTRLETRNSSQKSSTNSRTAAPASSNSKTVDASDSDFLFEDDDQDPISELEAMAASGDVPAFDLDDSDLLGEKT